MNTAFSAALLMGGHSRRMGVDKASLTDPESGLASWERQLNLLESLDPKDRLLSLREGQSKPGELANWRTVTDVVNDAGPISGLAACLDAAQESLVLVLGVDLLKMESLTLERLLETACPGIGAIYQNPHGFYEPLAAVYPKSAARSAQTFLENGGRKLQDWISEGVRSGWMQSLPLTGIDEAAFLNVNTEADYAKLAQ
jgi:molybdopterin-guanine dinucleotide biosynthesis protein A